MVIRLERGADLHMAQLMPLPLTISCSSKIQIGFTLIFSDNNNLNKLYCIMGAGEEKKDGLILLLLTI